MGQKPLRRPGQLCKLLNPPPSSGLFSAAPLWGGKWQLQEPGPLGGPEGSGLAWGVRSGQPTTSHRPQHPRPLGSRTQPPPPPPPRPRQTGSSAVQGADPGFLDARLRPEVPAIWCPGLSSFSSTRWPPRRPLSQSHQARGSDPREFSAPLPCPIDLEHPHQRQC